jgi:Mn2+/Fe2+ NRAMP family transporter
MNRLGSISSRMARLGPGIAIAATGVGAGDLIAASVCGVRFGTALAWSIVVGAVLKFVVNEGIARWHLGQGRSVLGAVVDRFHPAVSWLLVLYLLIWTPAVAAALAAACGIAASALWPALAAPTWGALHAGIACLLVLAGGYRLFERAMKGLIAVMFVSIVGTALWLGPDYAALTRGLLLPTLPPGSIGMVLAVIGGVGGSVTLLAYGYWIEEKGWRGPAHLGMARLDLGVAYVLTGIFGLALLALSSTLGVGEEELGGGAGLLIGLAEGAGRLLGRTGEVIFLAGVWGAVFTSMLGVWQGVPSLIADLVRSLRERREGRDVASQGSSGAGAGPDRLHQGLVIGIAVAAIFLVQFGRPLWLILTYAVIGSLFMPPLAFFLLRLNSPRGPQGRALGNGVVVRWILLASVALFLFLGLRKIVDVLT